MVHKTEYFVTVIIISGWVPNYIITQGRVV